MHAPNTHTPSDRCIFLHGVYHLLTIGCGLHLTLGMLSAQATSGSVSAGDDATVYKLSPFEVSTDQDVGYIAGSSLSGSRLNTNLRDTAAQVAVFTPEFIRDLGANSLEEVMQYSANFQTDTDDATPTMDAAIFSGVDKGTMGARFRIRNISGSRAMDFFESRIADDNYNVARFEAVSGPNSILFGFGAAGGVVNTTSKQALTGRSELTYRLQVGTWNRLRNELDINQVLLKDKLAVRLMGVDESVDSWRRFQNQKQRRGTVAATYRPFENTTFRVMHEDGETERQLGAPAFNAMDEYSLWVSAGSVVKNGFTAATDRPLGINNVAATHHTFVENTGTYFDAKNTLISTFENLAIPAAQRAGETMAPKDFFPYNISQTGPGAVGEQDLRQTRVFWEQRIGNDLSIEAAYNKMWNDDAGFIPLSRTNVMADPNLSVPVNGGGTAANRYAGAFYMERPWLKDTIFYDTESWRVTASYNLDLGKWFGNHRLAGMWQSDSTLVQRRINAEVLVDRNGVPISNPNPDAAANLLYRRNYLSLGQFDTYYPGRADNPFTATIGGREYVSRFVTRNQNGQNRSQRDTDTWMLAAQSYFWNDRVSVLFGYRRDDLTSTRYIAQRVRAGDARIASGERLLNEWDFSTDVTEQQRLKPITRSLGVVFHATSQISVSYNESSNMGQPEFLNVILIPDGLTPPNTRGRGRDYGVRFQLGNRAYLRVNRYETHSSDQTLPGGGGIEAGSTRILDAMLQRQVISQAEYDAHLVTGNAGLADSESEGIEVSLTANPTDHWSLQLNYSYTDQAIDNYFTAAEAGMRVEEAFWRSKIQAANLAPAQISTSAFSGSQGSIEDEIQVLFRDMELNRAANELGFGKRPHKANLFSRYTFASGRLKGFLVGGGLRYQSKSFNQRNQSTGTDYWGDPIFQVDLLLGYRTRIRDFWRGRSLGLSIQLNINNVLDDDKALPARYNNFYTALRRVYFQEPRTIRLTTTVSF